MRGSKRYGILLLSIILVIGFGIASSVIFSPGSRRILRVGTPLDFKPLFFLQGGEAKGILIDLISETSKALGFSNVDFIEVRRDVAASSLGGSVDVLVGDYPQIPGSTSYPLYNASQTFLYPLGRPAPSSLSDLSGHRVGYVKGSLGETVVKRRLIAQGLVDEKQTRGFDDLRRGIIALRSRVVDFLVTDLEIAKLAAKKYSLNYAFVIPTGKDSFMIAKSNWEFWDEAVSAIQSIKEGEEWLKIVQNYISL